MQLKTIEKSEQEEMIGSFWYMLQECEQTAMDMNNMLLRHQVRAWYEQWNRVTGDNKKPRFDA